MSAALRRAHSGDAHDLAGLNAAVHDDHVANAPGFFRKVEHADAVAYFAHVLESEGARAWIADDAGVAVGYALAFLRESDGGVFSQPRRWCELDQIAVREDRRREGIAHDLVAAVAAYAADNGISQVELTCGSFNTGAIEAFERLGFGIRTVRLALEAAGSRE